MTYKKSAYTKAFREFVRQIQRLSRPGLVKTWKAWEDDSSADDTPAFDMLPWVRLTPSGARSERSATYEDDGHYVEDVLLDIAIETLVKGYSADPAMDLWGELRDALFTEDTTLRLARDAAFEAVGVVDVIESRPVLPTGIASWSASGMVRSEGLVTLLIHMGV